MTTAGEKLRTAIDAALAREAEKLGQGLRFDEREQQHIDAACRCADAVELLDHRIAEERAGENRGTIIVKYLAERRMQDNKVSEHLKWIELDQFVPLKSPQHAAAANSRWTQRGRRGTA